jgi:hypothetical protein
VEKTETKKKPTGTSEGEGTVGAATVVADSKAPAGDDDIDEDWGMDSD